MVSEAISGKPAIYVNGSADIILENAKTVFFTNRFVCFAICATSGGMRIIVKNKFFTNGLVCFVMFACTQIYKFTDFSKNGGLK